MKDAEKVAILAEALNRIQRSCGFPHDALQRTIRDVARKALHDAECTEVQIGAIVA